MKYGKLILFACSTVVLFSNHALGQYSIPKNPLQVHYGAFQFEDQGDDNLIRTFSIPGLAADRQRQTSPRPYMSQPVETRALLGDRFWMGSVTTQSYNQGKVGRFYYWDLQGNLRGSYLFLDIAGKNKRGLKLVFPRHRVSF